MLRVLDLFSGIGGFSLGLERTGGFKTAAFCEIEPFCRKVLAKHWPEVPCYDDVRTLTAERLRADGIAVDVICGGFPCQDISVAGKGAGLEGERSGLWSEYARVIGELRPQFVLVENVSALLSRGLDKVLGDLASLGFDAEWHCIPASAVGAPHRRDRIWIVAHPARSGRGRVEPRRGPLWRDTDTARDGESGNAHDVADAKNDRPGWRQQQQESCEGAGHVADAYDQRKLQSQGRECDERGWIGNSGHNVSNAGGAGLSIAWSQPNGANGIISGRMLTASDWWSAEPDVGRVANGVPYRVDRLKGLGNAVVPQVVEMIGRAILR